MKKFLSLVLSSEIEEKDHHHLLIWESRRPLMEIYKKANETKSYRHKSIEIVILIYYNDDFQFDEKWIDRLAVGIFESIIKKISLSGTITCKRTPIWEFRGDDDWPIDWPRTSKM